MDKKEIKIITFGQYFAGWIDSPDATNERKNNAERLMLAVAKLMDMLELAGVNFPVNDNTHSQVSGCTFGGFRPGNCCQGSNHSAHKEGLAVDIYDPHGYIDDYLMLHQDTLVECGLYMEHPDSTKGWCHLGLRAPASGKRVFCP